ncbi:hypothetical protein ABFV99_26825 [Cytobacillus horneckiae]|nr:hypothetical protein [Cytobacillus horneckiae]MBN6887279.1 hypothetical protein [Cytobacillus horneckiae]MCM3178128.1 hypothetical protein [Cytobacillus horneckiae]MEC1157134.1 hypothetical protein [Cytobacillus horneckiae]
MKQTSSIDVEIVFPTGTIISAVSPLHKKNTTLIELVLAALLNIEAVTMVSKLLLLFHISTIDVLSFNNMFPQTL